MAWLGGMALLTAVAAVALVWCEARKTDPEDPALSGVLRRGRTRTTWPWDRGLPYYEAGLLALPVALSLETRLAWAVPGTGERLVLAAGSLRLPGGGAGAGRGVKPLVLLLAGLLAWSLFLSLRGRSSPQPA